MAFSVLILTLDEEISLPLLLERMQGISDDIVILDSHSTDATVEIAKRYGCRVYLRQFDNERAQRTFANSLPFKYEWVYNPDADEIPDDHMISEMQIAASETNPVAAYEVRFRNFLDGKWIRRSTDYPVWVIRFYRPKTLSFEREINLRYHINGEVRRFNGHFDHFPFAKGLSWWIEKHNNYSSKEAQEAIKVINNKSLRELVLPILSPNNSKLLRLQLKELSFQLPCRGLLRFIYTYFLKLGILDGRPGLKYSILISFYEYLIQEKIREKTSPK